MHVSQNRTHAFTVFLLVFDITCHLLVSSGGKGTTGLNPLTQRHPRVMGSITASFPQVSAENKVS